jgi:mannose-6-phosphate isomerase-like protein (cupin superfamily)
LRQGRTTITFRHLGASRWPAQRQIEYALHAAVYRPSLIGDSGSPRIQAANQRLLMPVKHLRFGKGFSVGLTNKRGQAATMVIAPGDGEGGPENKHRGADQWLFVRSGSGVAILGGRKHRITAGTIVLIERGTTHEIRNTGRTPLETVNIYVPPAYRASGDELPRGRS